MFSFISNFFDYLTIDRVHYFSALFIFIVCIFLFFFDKIENTIIALLGSVILVLTGVISFKEALNSIDFDAIALLVGLMMLVVVSEKSGIFSFITSKVAHYSKGNPVLVFLLFFLLTFFTSTILNNATVVLLVIPIAIALGSGIGINNKLMVVLVAIASNLGGTLTLIGDPPNTLIGSQVGLSFNDFLTNLWIPVVAMTLLVVLYVGIVYRKDIKPVSKNLSKLFVNTLVIEKIKYKLGDFVVNKSFYFLLLLSIAFFSIISFSLPINELFVELLGSAGTYVQLSLYAVLSVSFGLLFKKANRDLVKGGFTKIFLPTVLIIIFTVLSFVFQLSLQELLSHLFKQEIELNIGILGLLSGCVILLLTLGKGVEFSSVMKGIEWDSLLFFVALFVQVGALQKVGFLEQITGFVSMFNDNFTLILLIIVWGIGLASMFINNIPFVQLMIPVIAQLKIDFDSSGTIHTDLLWWALALGACLGGNGSVIGSSSGILAVNLAKKQGINVSFGEFMKIGVPITLITLFVSSVYLVIAANM